MSLDLVKEQEHEIWLTNSKLMVDLSVATFQLQEHHRADCKLQLARERIQLMRSRFAFVEYESRRDADDAYHEMHNKRIGRDDVLKIEVRALCVDGQAS